MKKIIYIIACLFSVKSNAQHINTIQIVPANPSTLDTVNVIVDMWFTSGTCDQHTQQSFVNINSIYCNTLHCTGMLAVICNDIDTFKINPLSAGNYIAYIQVNQGSLPAPCTPGIVAGESDSIAFTVVPVTSVHNNYGKDFFSVSYFKDDLHLSFKNKEDVIHVSLTDIVGNILFSSSKISNSLRIAKPAVNGVYLVNVTLKDGMKVSRKIVSTY